MDRCAARSRCNQCDRHGLQRVKFHNSAANHCSARAQTTYSVLRASGTPQVPTRTKLGSANCFTQNPTLHSHAFRTSRCVFAIALLIAYVLAGILVARLARPPAALVPALNGWAINVALPALILKLVPHVRFTTDLWFLPIAMWGVFFGACGLFLALGRALSWSEARSGAGTLVWGLGNTSFIGYPLIATLRGQEALDFALMADQLGTFVML